MKRFRISKEKNWKKAELLELDSLVNTMTNEELCAHFKVSDIHLRNTMQRNNIQRTADTLSKFRSETKQGEQNPNWRGGISKDNARYQALQRERHPEHKHARDAVYRALKDGTLVKPEKCEDCEKSLPLHGHHESYAQDQWLIVNWLCKKCHRKKHPQH